jgi:translation initiation factor eIF-2B subunit epsilon
MLLDQESIKGALNLGTGSNALVWLRGPPDEEEDLDDVENYKNQRFMRLGAFSQISLLFIPQLV